MGCQFHLFPYARHQLATDFNRIREIESKQETKELRKAQGDANAAASRAGAASSLGWTRCLTKHKTLLIQWPSAPHVKIQIHVHSCLHIPYKSAHHPGGTGLVSLSPLPIISVYRSQRLSFTLFSALQQGQSPSFTSPAHQRYVIQKKNPPEKKKEHRQCQLFADGGKFFFATTLVN